MPPKAINLLGPWIKGLGCTNRLQLQKGRSHPDLPHLHRSLTTCIYWAILGLSSLVKTKKKKKKEVKEPLYVKCA